MPFTTKAKKQLKELSLTSSTKNSFNHYSYKKKGKIKDIKKALANGKLWGTSKILQVVGESYPVLYNCHNKVTYSLGYIERFVSKKELKEIFGKGTYIAERYNCEENNYSLKACKGEHYFPTYKDEFYQVLYTYTCNYRTYYATKDLDFDSLILTEENIEKYSKYFLNQLPTKKNKIKKWIDKEIPFHDLQEVVAKEYNLYGGMIKETEGRAHVRDELRNIVKEANSDSEDKTLLENTLLANPKDYDYRKFTYLW